MKQNSENKKNIKSDKLGTMDKILILLGIYITIFTIVMIILFIMYQSVPDTLCTCVFGACVGECGGMSWIKTNKDKCNKEEIDYDAG